MTPFVVLLAVSALSGSTGEENFLKAPQEPSSQSNLLQSDIIAETLMLFQDALKRGDKIDVVCRSQSGLRAARSHPCIKGELPGAKYFDPSKIKRVLHFGRSDEEDCVEVVVAQGVEVMGWRDILNVCTIISRGKRAVHRAEFTRYTGLGD